MNTRLLLGSSAILMGAAGIAASFLPHELLAAFGVTASPPLVLLVQLAGALFFAFAMVNWTARGAALGGIYGRPIAIGNLAHFVIGALAAVNVVRDGATDPAILAITAVYAVFAAGFAVAFFRSPV